MTRVITLGLSEYGILYTCAEIKYSGASTRTCSSSSSLIPRLLLISLCTYSTAEWKAAAALIILGCLFTGAAVFYTAASALRSRHMRTARWLGFVAGASVCFSRVLICSCASFYCFTCVSGWFSCGSRRWRGGLCCPLDLLSLQAYKLPENTQVGYSYVLFVISILLLFIGELFAVKILCFQ